MLLDAGMFEAARTAAAAMAMAGARTCLRRAVRFVTGIARSVSRPSLVTEARRGCRLARRPWSWYDGCWG